jgi:hypothetical protein
MNNNYYCRQFGQWAKKVIHYAGLYSSISFSFSKRWFRTQQWKWLHYYLSFSVISPFPFLEEDKKHRILNYLYQDQKYSIQLLKKLRGPPPFSIENIFNQHHENVTEKIVPFLGPCLDFHHISYTPSNFGYSSLLFHLTRKGQSFSFFFSENDRLEFSFLEK